MKWKTRFVALGATLIGGFVVGGVALAAAPLPTASAGSEHANGTALGVPGVVTVSESDANRNGDKPNTATWSAVSVAGQSLLGKQGSNEWTGLLAALGPTIDMINAQSCSGQPTDLPTGGQAFACFLVVPGQSNTGTPNATGNVVSGALILNEANNTPLNGLYQFEVLGSFAQAGGCNSIAYANIARVRVLSGLGDETVPVGHTQDFGGCSS